MTQADIDATLDAMDPANDPPAVLEAVKRQSEAAAAVPDNPDALHPEQNEETQSLPPPPRFEFIDSATFASGDYKPKWIVPRVLVKGQPGCVAGPSKSLKTTILVDLAVSVASGRPFLNEFQVTRPARVAVVSGESGQHTLQETAQRVCRAREVSLLDLGDRLNWCFTLPTLADVGIMADFADQLVRLNAELVLLDPFYLMLGSADPRSIFEMGSVLRVVAEILLQAGCTPVIAHHANGRIPDKQPMELSHLAYSGLEQFVRQFILLNRREVYAGDGRHDLWVRIGGSAGFGGLWSLHAEEGVIDEHFEGREWRTELQTMNDVREQEADRKAEAKREAARKKRQEEETEVLGVIGAGAVTKNTIRERTGFSSSKVSEILDYLLERGEVEEASVEWSSGRGGKRTTGGFRRAQR